MISHFDLLDLRLLLVICEKCTVVKESNSDSGVARVNLFRKFVRPHSSILIRALCDTLRSKFFFEVWGFDRGFLESVIVVDRSR